MKSFAKGFKKISLIGHSTLFISTLILAQTACATTNIETKDQATEQMAGGHAAVKPSVKDGFYINSDRQMIVPFVLSAKKTLDIEIYQFTDPVFVSALRTQMNKGVKIRVVKEPAPVGDKCLVFNAPAPNEDAVCAEQRKLKAEIIKSGGTYVPFNKAELCGTPAVVPGPQQVTPNPTAVPVCFEHGKMILVDKKAVLISTGNFNSSNLCNLSNNPERCNRDYSIVSSKSNVVKAFGKIFAKDVLQKAYDINSIIGSVPEITVSPDSFAPLTAFIASAKKSIRIENQYLNFAPLNDALIEAASRGVKVQVMVASLCAFGRPGASEIAKANRIYGGFEQVGIESRMFTTAIKINGKDGYLHAKAIVVDEDRAWVGSVNGSNSAINVNREFGMFMDDAASVQALKQSFDRDFTSPGSETWQESTVCAKDYVAPAPEQAI